MEMKSALKDSSASFVESTEQVDAVRVELETLEQKVHMLRFMHISDAEERVRQLKSRVVEVPPSFLTHLSH